MQRIVRWNVGSYQEWNSHGSGGDLDRGNVSYFEVTAERLEKISPKLRAALTRDEKIGRIVDHTYSIEGPNRIFTFVVTFD